MSTLRSTLLVLALNFCACLAAAAASRPYTATESARATLPAGYTGYAAAIEGSWAAAVGVNYDTDTAAIFLYRRASASSWVLDSKIYETHHDVSEDFPPPISLAMEGGILAFGHGSRPAIFRRSGSTWLPQVVENSTSLESVDARIDGTRVMFGSSGNCGDAVIFEPDAAGTWRITGRLNNVESSCFEFSGPFSFDLSGDYAIVHARNDETGDYHHNVYRRSSATGSWTRVGVLPPPAGGEVNSWDVSLRGSLAVAEGRYPNPMHVLLRSGTTWNELPGFRPLDAYRLSSLGGNFRERRGWLAQLRDDADIPYNEGPNAIVDVWRQQTDNRFTHVAQLEAHDRAPLGGLDIDDTRIIALSRATSPETGGVLNIFELPASLATPAPVRDDFNGNGNATWHTVSGTPPTVEAGDNRRFQFASTPRTITLAANSNWTNQAVEAHIQPGTSSSSQSLVGLVARYDSGNYYYAAITRDHQVQLARVRGGTRTVLASVPFTPNYQAHRLRLEARGQLLDVSLDGALLIRSSDSALRSGEAGFIGEYTLFRADNFTVTPRSLKTYATNFTNEPLPGDDIQENPWTFGGGDWGNAEELGGRVRQQRSATGAARAITGVATDEQTVETLVRADSALTTDSNWVGVIARYKDNKNLYYLSLRGGRLLELRKVVNGVATSLGYHYINTMQPSKFYSLRLDVIGDQLRGYIDGEQLIQASDTDLATGRSGIATNNARASFASFLSYQP